MRCDTSKESDLWKSVLATTQFLRIPIIKKGCASLCFLIKGIRSSLGVPILPTFLWLAPDWHSLNKQKKYFINNYSSTICQSLQLWNTSSTSQRKYVVSLHQCTTNTAVITMQQLLQPQTYLYDTLWFTRRDWWTRDISLWSLTSSEVSYS